MQVRLPGCGVDHIERDLVLATEAGGGSVDNLTSGCRDFGTSLYALRRQCDLLQDNKPVRRWVRDTDLGCGSGGAILVKHRIDTEPSILAGIRLNYAGCGGLRQNGEEDGHEKVARNSNGHAAT